MRIIYRNETDLPSSILSSSTALTSYAVTNLQNQRLSSTYRTANITSATIVLSCAAYNDSVNTLALINHNLTSSATVTISFNTANSWPGATSQTVTYNAGMMLTFFTMPQYFITTEAGDFLITEAGDYIVTDNQYQFMQIVIADPTNTNGHLEIGKLWIGSYITIDPASLLSFSITKKSSDIVTRGKYRQKFAIKGANWRQFRLSFPKTSYTTIKKIEDMFNHTGTLKPVIFCNFDTDRSYAIVEPCYCSIANDITLNHDENMAFTYDLLLEEDK